MVQFQQGQFQCLIIIKSYCKKYLCKMENKFITPNAQLRNQYVPCESVGKNQSYKEYLQKLIQMGLQVNQKIYPSIFKLKNGLQYTGLATKQVLHPQQVFVKVPKSLMLSSFIAIQRPQLQQIFKQSFYHICDIWNFRVLNTYMLYIYGIKQTQNIWYYMLSQLSNNIDIVAFWTEQQFKKINDQEINITSKIVQSRFQLQWAEFIKIKDKYQILKNPVFNKQNYRWIYVHSASRFFGKKIQFLSFAPFCEFFNHHSVDGSYGVQKSQSQSQLNSNFKKNQVEDNKVQTTSISSDGSCQSEDYIGDGQFNYSFFQNSLSKQQKCLQKIEQDKQKQMKIIGMKNKVLNFLNQSVKWSDFSIIFVSNIFKKCNQILNFFETGRQNYQHTLQNFSQIYDSVQLYHKKLVSYYKKYHKHSYQKYLIDVNLQKSKSTLNYVKYNDIYAVYSQKTQTIIQLPTQQKLIYDKFVLYNGKKASFQPNNQVYFGYGKDSNHTLLYWYGFCIEGNKYQNVRFNFDIHDFLRCCDAQFQTKYKQKHLSLKRKFRLKRNQLNVDMIMFFRQKLWSYQNNNSIQSLFDIKNYQKQIHALNLMKQQIELKLLNFNQQYDLTDPKLSYHEYFITIYLKEKRIILEQHRGFMQKLVEFLQKLSKGLQVKTAKDQLSQHEKYILRLYLSEF